MNVYPVILSEFSPLLFVQNNAMSLIYALPTQLPELALLPYTPLVLIYGDKCQCVAGFRGLQMISSNPNHR